MPKFRTEIANILYKSLTLHVDLQPQVFSDTLGFLVLHISEGCNLGCTYCFADRGQYGNSAPKWMAPEKAVASTNAVLQKYKRLEGIKFFGGEPFLNMDVIEAVCNYLSEKVSRTELESIPHIHAITNLTICNERVLSLVKRFNIQLTASIDGPQEIHDAFRIFNNGRGSFEVVDRNIHLFRQHTGQPAVLEVVYNPRHLENGMRMPDVHEFLEDRYNIYDIVLHPMEPHPPASFLIPEQNWIHYREAMYELAMEYGQYVVQRAFKNCQASKMAGYFMRMTEPLQKDAHCDLGVDTITVGADGRVYPCYTFMGRGEFVMADDCTSETLGAEKFQKVQSVFLTNKKSDNPICTECSILKTCRQCPGEMIHEGGSINVTVPTACNYLVGFVEGMLLGLNDARLNPEYWDEFMKSLPVKEILSIGV